MEKSLLIVHAPRFKRFFEDNIHIHGSDSSSYRIEKLKKFQNYVQRLLNRDFQAPYLVLFQERYLVLGLGDDFHNSYEGYFAEDYTIQVNGKTITLDKQINRWIIKGVENQRFAGIVEPYDTELYPELVHRMINKGYTIERLRIPL